ncbi:flagellar export chaperone FlgN [Thalassolituus sp.]|jgi:flagella synthesis protein FlgN|uniref:flagellar export chaperone FlgN n=1 Tax=Thalassolituus sp. TaxID=2030822 RepID=UPI002A81378B|nr:flagellar export chaperone FlgN [Thalassolituus sp.]
MQSDTEFFAELLNTELKTTCTLHSVLQRELSALSAKDMDVLQRLTSEKKTLLTGLQQQAQQRLQWLTDQDLPHNNQCLQRHDLAAHGDIPSLWQQLIKQYEQNQDLSVRLSEVVLSLRYRTQQQLKILHGRYNDPHLYNNEGKASGLALGNSCIQA